MVSESTSPLLNLTRTSIHDLELQETGFKAENHDTHNDDTIYVRYFHKSTISLATNRDFDRFR